MISMFEPRRSTQNRLVKLSSAIGLAAREVRGASSTSVEQVLRRIVEEVESIAEEIDVDLLHESIDGPLTGPTPIYEAVRRDLG